jgi:hypothetical protein
MIDTLTLVDDRMEKYNQIKGPRVGDYLRIGEKYVRFSHDWGDKIQTSKGGSFYLGDGYISFSGGLDPAIPKAELKDTGETRTGYIWVFKKDWWAANNGCDFEREFRVFEKI